MITDAERREIIEQVKEEILLAIPDIIGNLMTNHMSLIRINKDFYDKHKEFASNKDAVASIVEMIEGQNPGMDYKEILEKAVPLVRERIKTVKSLDMKSAPRPSRNISHLEFKGNGEL